MFHRLSEDGIAATYGIDYQIGAGKVGHSYLAKTGDFLLESPVSRYKNFGWDISPGYRSAELLDFSRVLSERCVFCHSNRAEFSEGRRFTGDELTAISCERCHGNTSAHVGRPSASNIVNPVKLAGRARDSVCEQCHLEGVARVLNPGKRLGDFRPGEDLEQTLAIYVARQAGARAPAVSQVEQLASSKCARASEGKLWCGTCHNPHGETQNRRVEITAVCSSCHPRLSAASHPAGGTDCVRCHMPSRKPTDVEHAALTDHRILARPIRDARAASTVVEQLEAWREPPGAVRQRNLALAEIEAAAKPGWESFGLRGSQLLEQIDVAQLDGDAPALSALGSAKLSEGAAGEAATLFERALQVEPKNGQYALYLGTALKQSGDLAGAVRNLRLSIELDPSLEKSFLELSSIYVKQGKKGEAKELLDRYLQWNPQSVLVQLTKEGLESGAK